jgi:hypothetical protein
MTRLEEKMDKVTTVTACGARWPGNEYAHYCSLPPGHKGDHWCHCHQTRDPRSALPREE